MSNNESFIDEVSEELRRDQLYAAFRKYGWIAVLAVLVIVGAAAFREWKIARDTAAAQARGDAILAAANMTDPAARQAAFDAITPDGDAAIVAMLAASADQQGNTPDAAASRLEALAADQSQPVIYRDIAALKAVMMRGSTMDATARISALQPLTVPGRPLRLLAEEQIAFAQLDAGDSISAIATLQAIVEDAGVSQSLRDRVTGLLTALGVTPTAQ